MKHISYIKYLLQLKPKSIYLVYLRYFFQLSYYALSDLSPIFSSSNSYTYNKQSNDIDKPRILAFAFETRSTQILADLSFVYRSDLDIQLISPKIRSIANPPFTLIFLRSLFQSIFALFSISKFRSMYYVCEYFIYKNFYLHISSNRTSGIGALIHSSKFVCVANPFSPWELALIDYSRSVNKKIVIYSHGSITHYYTLKPDLYGMHHQSDYIQLCKRFPSRTEHFFLDERLYEYLKERAKGVVPNTGSPIAPCPQKIALLLPHGSNLFDIIMLLLNISSKQIRSTCSVTLRIHPSEGALTNILLTILSALKLIEFSNPLTSRFDSLLAKSNRIIVFDSQSTTVNEAFIAGKPVFYYNPEHQIQKILTPRMNTCNPRDSLKHFANMSLLETSSFLSSILAYHNHFGDDYLHPLVQNRSTLGIEIAAIR